MNVPNEGVLIKALIDNTTVVPLHFCYVNGKRRINKRRIPTVSFINSSFVKLSYKTTTYIVTFTASSGVEPYLYNININNDLLLNQTVRFAWNQTYIAVRANCDVWALDNISISLHHNGCYRQIYQQDFNNDKTLDWDLVNSTISILSSQCDSLSGCLYSIFNQKVATRQATSPMLDLHVITPVTLSSSPTTIKEYTCDIDEDIM